MGRKPLSQSYRAVLIKRVKSLALLTLPRCHHHHGAPTPAVSDFLRLPPNRVGAIPASEASARDPLACRACFPRSSPPLPQIQVLPLTFGFLFHKGQNLVPEPPVQVQEDVEKR